MVEPPRVELERDLYRRCLDLVRGEDPSPLLDDALELLRAFVGAERGYIEIQDVSRPGCERWSASVGVDSAEREVIVERISRGVIAEAIETGEIVHTPSALLDQRFGHRESVQRAAIEAVLCVPLRAADVVGVVYLQNRIGGGAFGSEAVECAQTVAGYVSRLSGRLLELLRRRAAEDRTTGIRARMRTDGVVGRSVALAELLGRVEIVAALDTNVLFTGECGTGKSMFAKLLHAHSPRAGRPFVELNCAALPEALAESELFGAERGAHSAVAQQGMLGKVAAAEGGTLFLDEIGTLPLGVQAKLLQLVQNKEYFRLGGTRPVRANVRIVTATNIDLERAVADRTFREDLYYRIKGVQIRMPSLAERREDVAVLARHFCVESCSRSGIPAMSLSPAASAAIERADWPGNIRQLASACEEAVINARVDGAAEIGVRHLFPELPGDGSDVAPATFQSAREQWERAFIAQKLEENQWNVTATAEQLDMSRSHLNALIRRYGIRRKT